MTMHTREMDQNQQLQRQQLVEVDITKDLDVEKLSETHYRGIKPLSKPHPTRRGVYGGALCAQAVLVAIRSSPEGFMPNAMHTFFTRAASEDSVIDWKVEKISDGRSFANRSISAIQNGKVVFTANISLTTKNTTKLGPGPKPFTYQTTPEPELADPSLTEMDNLGNPNLHMGVKYPLIPQSENVFPYFIKYGIDGLEKVKPMTLEYKYAAFTWITDWMDIERVLDIMGHQIKGTFNVSLDHSVYFHDDDIDPTHWTAVSFKTTRLSHDRALLVCELYNDKNVQVATVVQERLFKGNLVGAKL